MKFLTSFVLLTVAFVFRAESISYPFHVVLKENVFDVYWSVNTTEDRFYFKVVANTTGWVGFAVTTNEGAEDMINYDIALGGVRNMNESYLKDYWSATETKPTLDSNQNLALTSAMESNGKTTIEFNRKADTGDTLKDASLKNNKTFLAWAIGLQDATDDTNFIKHPNKAEGGRGHTDVGYNMYTGVQAPTVPPTITTTTQAGSVIVPSIVALVLIQLGIQVFN